MRIDKFLKVSRLIKRRTVAKDASDQGRVFINGLEVKPSRVVKIGDEVTIQFGQKQITIRIDQINETAKKNDASDMYTVINETTILKSETNTNNE